MKRWVKMSFIHKFICIGLLVAAIMLCFRTEYYLYDFDCSKDNCSVSFLQVGDYMADIYYEEAVENNEVIVFSHGLINDENQVGVELARVPAVSESGNIQLMLELEQDTYDVGFTTAQDTEDVNYISHVRIQGAQMQNTDNFILALFCIIGAVATFVLGAYVSVEKYAEPIGLLLLGLAAGIPMYADYIMWGHDLGFHVSRLESIYLGLCAGEFPVYLGTSQMGGYGMLSSTMYPDFFLHPFALLFFCGASKMFVYKVFVVCMHIGCAFSTYYSMKNICKNPKIAAWTTVFYTFSIYRLTNTYFRAALGETLAMVFFPIVIWGIYEIFWKNYKKWYILALGMCGLVQSHVLSVEMCLLFLVLETIVWIACTTVNDKLKRFWAAVKATVLTILANAFFIIPFLVFCREDLQCFNLSYRLADATATLSQTFSAFAQTQAYNRGTGYTAEVMPHTIGLNLLLGVVLFGIEVYQDKEKSPEMQLGKRCLVYGILAVCMASPLFPWDEIQKYEFLNNIVTSLQFAWRFHALASVFLCITTAIGVVRFAEHTSERKWVYALFMAMVIFSTSYYFENTRNEASQFGNKMEFESYGGTDSLYLYTDEGKNDGYMHLRYNRNNAFVFTWNGTPVAYSEHERKGIGLKIIVDAPDYVDDYLVFPLYYYPGYEILVDGESVRVEQIDRKVACVLPSGTTSIEVNYVGLPIFKVANCISIITIIGIILCGFRKKLIRNATLMQKAE